MCPNMDRHHDWIIAVRLGCLVILLTSSLRTSWCHLTPSSVLKHRWYGPQCNIGGVISLLWHWETFANSCHIYNCQNGWCVFNDVLISVYCGQHCIQMHAICCGSGLYSVRSSQCKLLHSIVSACQVMTCGETEKLKGLGKSVTAGEHMMAMSWNLSGRENGVKEWRRFLISVH